MKTKLPMLMIMLILSAQINCMAQNMTAKPDKKLNTTEEAVATNTRQLVLLKNEFITLAKVRITENEKSVVTLKAAYRFKNKQELDYYREKVLLFESRNNDLNNKMYAFNVVSGTLSQFNEFKKRWFWAFDELSVYEKNLNSENLIIN